MAKLNWTKQAGKMIMLRFFTAAILFVWIGQMLPPLIALAADESCQLSCCRGLARHAAGSCEGGECHLHPKKRLHQPELICGGAELAKKSFAPVGKSRHLFADHRLLNVPIFDETKSDSRSIGNLSFVQATVLEQSCQTVCCVSGSHNSGQQNKSANESAAIIAFVAALNPPTAGAIEFSTSVAGNLSQIIVRRAPARAPPRSFS